MKKLNLWLVGLLLGKRYTIKHLNNGDVIITSNKTSKLYSEYLKALDIERFRNEFNSRGHDYISTIHAVISYGRRSGSTTRQADFSIQALFAGQEVLVLDHSDTGRNSDKYLFRLILERLDREHGLNMDKGLHVDKDKHIIKISNHYLEYIKNVPIRNRSEYTRIINRRIE